MPEPRPICGPSPPALVLRAPLPGPAPVARPTPANGGPAGTTGTVVGEMDSVPPDPADRPSRRRPLDRRTVAICICLALVAALLAGLTVSVITGNDDADSAKSDTLALGRPIDPDALVKVELTTIGGDATTLDAFLGARPLLVNLWKQDCIPCVDEMPLLEALHQQRDDLDVLGVDVEDRLDKALVMAERTGITYPWVQDLSGDFFFEAQAAGMPTTLLVNPGGTVLAAKTGSFKDAAELDKWVERYLGPAGP